MLQTCAFDHTDTMLWIPLRFGINWFIKHLRDILGSRECSAPPRVLSQRTVGHWWKVTMLSSSVHHGTAFLSQTHGLYLLIKVRSCSWCVQQRFHTSCSCPASPRFDPDPQFYPAWPVFLLVFPVSDSLLSLKTSVLSSPYQPTSGVIRGHVPTTELCIQAPVISAIAFYVLRPQEKKCAAWILNVITSSWHGMF
jgi:hypothetical protein